MQLNKRRKRIRNGRENKNNEINKKQECRPKAFGWLLHYSGFINKSNLVDMIKRKLYPNIISKYLCVNDEKDTYLYIKFLKQYNHNEKAKPFKFNNYNIKPTI